MLTTPNQQFQIEDIHHSESNHKHLPQTTAHLNNVCSLQSEINMENKMEIEGKNNDEGDEYSVSLEDKNEKNYKNELVCPNLTYSKLEKFIVDFIRTFNPKISMEFEDTDSLYCQKLKQLWVSGSRNLLIDGNHIIEFDEYFYWHLVLFPGRVIIEFDRIVNKIFKKKFGRRLNLDNDGEPIAVQITALHKNNNIRSLNQNNLNKLVSIKGIVIRCSDIYPEMKEATFRCIKCIKYVRVEVQHGGINEPSVCPECDSRSSFELVHNECAFIDKQIIKLQETPEQIPQGETPIHISLIAFDRMVDYVKPGDTIEVVGIYQARALRVSRGRRILNAIFDTNIDVISMTFLHKNSIANKMGNDVISEKALFSEMEIRKFKEFSKRNSVITDLIDIFAGSLWEMNDVKKGLLCQLFGGTPKEFDPAFRGRYRSDLNVLLVGDPSTAKSQLLKCVHKVSPRGLYTSGKGSSAVGLTAYITKDPESHELVLESGALVLSDRGICCIDEFDKMNDNAKVILHEVMEQQTISIAKAGIVCSLNARTAILAAANPIESRYNSKKSIIYNIKLPPALISRFDLIFLMLDTSEETQDRRLAKHICELYTTMSYDEKMIVSEREYDQKFLAKYINYARMTCKPKIPEKTEEVLIKGYLEMRSMGASKNIISATPRHLEAMIRISESLAKMRLDRIVEESDAIEAINLVKSATRKAAMDPLTGQIDMNMIATGYSSLHEEKLKIIEEWIKDLMVN